MNRRRVLATDRNRHASDSDRDRIAAERTEMKRLDGYAFIEAELAQTVGLPLVEGTPVDGRHAGRRADGQPVEANRVRMKRRVHCCD